MIQESPTIPSHPLVAGSDIKKFYHLFSKAPVGIAIYTGPSFIIRFINDSTLDVWGKKKEEVLGKPLFEIFPELVHSGIGEILNNVYKKPERFKAKEYEVSFLKNGAMVTGYFDFILEPISNTEGILDIIAVASEVTDEVNSALNKEEEKTLSPLLIKSSLISIDKQTTRLTRLMSELLDLSKIETGRLELNKELASLNEIVIETVQDILYTNSKHDIRVYHDFGCNVYCDKDRIGQVLINLLTNAIKYSPHSDKIEVWIRQSAGNYVSVSVKDYGIGIDVNDQERVFERFYWARGKEEQTFPGFGIGLFIAKEIIQRHSGIIGFESEKGKGSVFTFTLPVAQEKN